MLALAVAALPAAAALAGFAPPVRVGRPGAAFLVCLLGLLVWTGASVTWSLSPDSSWQATNRMVVYVAFAVAGLVLASWLPRPALAGARAAAVLLALLYGWALLAKCVPGLYPDYERIARLRAPLGYWNELGLLGAAGVPVSLWLAAPGTRKPAGRTAGVVLLYAAVVVTLLTYSRVGIALAALAAVAWLLLADERVESLAALALGGGAGIAVFGVALALPGITSDGEPHSTRAVDGAIFAVVVLAAAAAVALVAAWLGRRAHARPLADGTRRAVERLAARVAVAVAVVLLVAGAVFAKRLWHTFANPVTSQIGSGTSHVASFNSSNRWRWWQEEWSAFTGHPLLGTGAATFHITDLRLRTSSLVTTEEPHNTPLQFLGELGLPGFLLYLGVAAAAAAGVVAARRRVAREERAAVTALGLALAVFGLHTVVDMDWSFLATCGPMLLVAGLLLGRERSAEGVAAPVRRRLVAAAAVLVAGGCVYSLAAPWLSQRAVSGNLTLAAVKRAHSYDPLAVAPLLYWAELEDARGNVLEAVRHYTDATALEPETSEVWYELGLFYYDHKAWARAYDALSKAWLYDPYTVGVPCGLLDQARHKALGVWPPSCPRGSRPAATP